MLLYFDTWSIIILRALFSVVNLNVEQKPVHSIKEPQRFKTWQKWRVKKAKSKSLSNSKSGNVRCNLTSKIHNHHETLELILIIKPLGFPKVDLLTSWYYTMNQKHLWKKAYILNLKNEAMLLVKTFLIHN